MVTQAKKDQVAEIAEKLGRSKSLVLFNFSGINVQDISDLRGKLRTAQAELKVVKNRLTNLALAQVEFESCEEILEGPTALAFGYEAVEAPAKVLSEFAKDHESLTIKGGFIGTHRIGVEDISALAKMPPRQVLLGRLLGSIQSPPTRLCRVLKASINNVCYALKAVADQKQ